MPLSSDLKNHTCGITNVLCQALSPPLSCTKKLQCTMSDHEGEWLNAGASLGETSGPTSQRAARRAVGSSNKEALTRELNSLKMQAWNAQQTRLNASVGMWTMRVPFALVKTPLAVAKDFATKHKGQSMHKFGSPHVQVWRSFMVSLIAQAKKEFKENKNEKLEDAINTMNMALSTFETDGPKQGHKHIRQCRIKQCREEANGLVHYALSTLLENPRKVDLAIHLAIEAVGGSVLPGTAPPNELERMIQTNIESVKAMLATM